MNGVRKRVYRWECGWGDAKMCVLCVVVMCFWGLSDWLFFFLNVIEQLLFVCSDSVFIVYTFYLVMYCVDICLH